MGEPDRIKGNSAPRNPRLAYTPPRVRFREDKANINGGMNEAEKKAVLATEGKIRGRKKEVVYAVDANGNAVKVSTSGTSSRARIDRRLVPDSAVITHNHPDSSDKPIYVYGRRIGVKGGGTGLGARIGAAHSGNDLRTAISVNAKEIRAVTPTYTFSIRRPANGWNVSADKVFSEWQDVYNGFIRRTEGYRKQGREQLGRVNAVASHQATREIAKRYGFTYTRKKN